jgi:3-oxosteroid 1-dehydrogenase
MIWVPCNPHMDELGIPDSRDEALTYLNSLSHGTIDEKLAAAYIDAGPEMVEFLEANAPIRFSIIAGFPDYHPEHARSEARGAARWSARCSRAGAIDRSIRCHAGVTLAHV